VLLSSWLECLVPGLAVGVGQACFLNEDDAAI